MPKLNSQEIDEFLTEPGHILRLATVDADGAPRVMPIWFIYEEGQGEFSQWKHLPRQVR